MTELDNTMALIHAKLAMPAVCRMVVRYDDGAEKTREIRSWEIGEREAAHWRETKVGREFVIPNTGKTRRMVSVDLVAA